MLAHLFPLLYSQGVAPVVVTPTGPCARVRFDAPRVAEVSVGAPRVARVRVPAPAVAAVVAGGEVADVEVRTCRS